MLKGSVYISTLFENYSNSKKKKNIEIARWRLRSSMFSIFPILSDFLDMKLLKNSDFFEETHVNIWMCSLLRSHTCKNENFLLIFKHCDIVSWLRRKSLQVSTKKLCAIFKMEIPSVFVALMIRSHERFSHNRARAGHEWRKLTAKEVFFNHRLHLHYCCF